jgi:hypothetical protein
MAKRRGVFDLPEGGYDPIAETAARFDVAPISMRPKSDIGLESTTGESGNTAGGVSRQMLAKIMAAAAGRAPGTEGMKSDLPLAHGRISQRFPTSKKSGGEDPLKDNLLINMDVLRSEPAKLKQASDIIAGYPMTTKEMLEMSPEERVNAFRDQLAGNYGALYDMMGPEKAARASQWYHGANRISGERAREVGVPHASAAGSFAALSPQKDWFQNVYLGDAVLRTLGKDPKFDTDMLRKAATMDVFGKGTMPDMLRSLEGRRLSNMTPEEQAIAIRLWDETHGPQRYHKISPEGDYGDIVLTKGGEPAKPAWGTFGDIQKAVEAAQSGGDPSLISPLMGGKHKVRNFYNNIIAPTEGAPFGDITADTHQIAAGHFRPLSGGSPEVLQGLQSGSKDIAGPPVSATTGLRGLYPIYADATRQAAAERDIPTIAMQSTPWEAVRALFPAEGKTAKTQLATEEIWRAHGRGEITAEEARRRIIAGAGGFKPPSW